MYLRWAAVFVCFSATSIIDTDQANTLTIENNQIEQTLLEMLKNQDLQEIVDILAEFYEEMEDADDELGKI